MVQDCKFCSDVDIQNVIPGLSVDLFAAIESGVVLDTGVIEEHNQIDNPQSIVTRVRDVFHAMDLQKAYLQAGKITPGSTIGSTEHSSSVSLSSSSSATAGE